MGFCWILRRYLSISKYSISFLEHVSKINKLNVRQKFYGKLQSLRRLGQDFGILDFRIATFVRILTGILWIGSQGKPDSVRGGPLGTVYQFRVLLNWVLVVLNVAELSQALVDL